jgi:capsular polysaccharide transport system permease protein
MRFRHRVTVLSFVALVAIPTLLVTLFEAFIAAPRYVSEAKFIVRSVNSHHTTGLDTIFSTLGISRAADDSSAIQKYIVSRDAVAALNAKLPLREIFGRSEADPLSKFPPFYKSNKDENLYDYYLSRVSIFEEDSNGVISLKAQAFRPEDSKSVVTGLVGLAEQMVNRLNERAQRDTIDSAKQDVDLAEQRIIDADASLEEYRAKELLVDPYKSSLAMFELIGTLTTQMTQASVQLKDAQSLSPSGPEVANLQINVASLQDRINQERAKLVGADSSLASKIATYERLVMTRQISEKALELALSALDSARTDARRQHIYIEEIVKPSLPDVPTAPERVRTVLTTFVFGFALFSIIWILSVGVGEHSQ